MSKEKTDSCNAPVLCSLSFGHGGDCEDSIKIRSGIQAILERWDPKHDRGSHGENFEAVLAELRSLVNE